MHELSEQTQLQRIQMIEQGRQHQADLNYQLAVVQSNNQRQSESAWAQAYEVAEQQRTTRNADMQNALMWIATNEQIQKTVRSREAWNAATLIILVVVTGLCIVAYTRRRTHVTVGPRMLPQDQPRGYFSITPQNYIEVDSVPWDGTTNIQRQQTDIIPAQNFREVR